MLKYREMKDNDATIGALLFCMKMLIRNAKWSVQPASEDAGDVANASFVEECLFSDADNSFDDVIAEACTMIEYGYSIMEMVFRRRRFSEGSKFNDGKIGIRKLGIRSQDTIWRWVFDELEERDKILAVCQLTIPQGEMLEIPYEKCLHFKTEPNRDNPEGRSFLRNAYRSYVFKKNIEEIEGIGIERDLAGLPVIQVPPKLLEADDLTSGQVALFEHLEAYLSQIRNDETAGCIIPAELDEQGNPTGFKLSLLSTGGSRMFDTTRIIERWDKRILMSVLADFIMLGQSNVGSFALSSDKTTMFSYALGAILDIIETELNRKLIPTLMRLNGVGYPFPCVKHGDVESPNLSDLSTYVKTLTDAGMLTPDRELEAHLRDVGNLPPIPEEAADASEQPEDDADLEKHIQGAIENLDGEQRKEIAKMFNLGKGLGGSG